MEEKFRTQNGIFLNFKLKINRSAGQFKIVIFSSINMHFFHLQKFGRVAILQGKSSDTKYWTDLKTRKFGLHSR